MRLTVTRQVALSATGIGSALVLIGALTYYVLDSVRTDLAAHAEAMGGSEALTSIQSNIDSYMMLLVGLVAFFAALAVSLGYVLVLNIRKKLTGAVEGLTTSASGLLSVAAQVTAGAEQTAVSTTETNATVEEVKQTAVLASEKASDVAEKAQDANRVAGAGRQAVEDTIAGIERMQEQMAVVAQTIGRLSDQTQAVSEIIATVSDLAEQSNLLSVNASIEAAKAGEQGRGFTVVAQEVKSLAEQSKQAVSQVRSILGEIQKAGSMAVDAAEQSREAIEAGRRQSLESGDAIQALADAVAEASQAAVQIAASSRQQLAGMEQISDAIHSIDQAGSQTADGTKEVEQEVRQIQELAARLQALVDPAAV